MRVIVSITREGVTVSAPDQEGVLFGFDAWEAFLRRAKKGWFDLAPPARTPERKHLTR
ncbi:hypothetical protein AB0395_02045 [Streptosporangium sp. NPDC051023]|uniref:hypothetical protein n=1 Tax=Streptosporangium sp. NPDC051023 TaxID=3155410 RepID=UPI00344D7B04